jgi:hypothetical protein
VRARRFPYGIILGLAALAAASRLAFLWAPNVAPTFFITFAAGIAYGARAGAAVGALSMLVTNVLISALNPVLIVNTAAMAFLGVAGGVLGRFVNFGQFRDAHAPLAAAVAGFVGAVTLVAFSVTADAMSWLMYYRNGVEGLLTLVIAGFAFNAVPSIVNALVFAAGTYPVLQALRKAGLVTPRRPARPTPSSTPT